MRELVFATVLAEIKNAFVDEINDPDLIQLLYGGVAYTLKITIGKVQKGAASKIMNREPGGRPLRVIKGHSQDEGVKKSIGQYFKQNVIKHFMPGMEDEIIFHLRGVIKEDKNIPMENAMNCFSLARRRLLPSFWGRSIYIRLRETTCSAQKRRNGLAENSRNINGIH